MDPIGLGCWLCAIAAVCWVLRSVNGWVHEGRLGAERRRALPPGDLGWPLFGRMWSFLWAFKSGNPDAFIGGFIRRFGRTGIYKTYMFGSPTILITTAEGCKQILMDDDRFIPGWPRATRDLIGKKSFVEIPHEEHKRLRRMTAAPVNGYEALSTYLKFIDGAVVAALDNWSNRGEIEFLTEIRKLAFKIIMHIFLSMVDNRIMEQMEMVYTELNYGIRAMAINLPGFAFHRALKARKKLVAVLQSALDERREQKKQEHQTRTEKDMMDNLIECRDEKGTPLSDEEIIDLLIMYLNAGHESTAHITMWTAVLLHRNPEILRKAKEEQLEIKKNMPPTQKGLTLKDVRKMEYLSKVTDEALRWVNLSFVRFREATTDVMINGNLLAL